MFFFCDPHFSSHFRGIDGWSSMCMCPDQIRKSSEDVKRVPFPNLEREHWSQQKPTAKQASFFEVAADLATVSMLLQACLKKKMKMVLWPLSSRNPSWK